MPASIHVESGIAAGTRYWIDRPVLRIGSDPQCEICLPSADLPAHALTIEFRGGQYRAYNRGSEAIHLGDSVVPPGGSSAWEAHDAMHLSGDLRLTLDIDGDPRPSTRPEVIYDVDHEVGITPATLNPASAPNDAAKETSSRTLVQLGVIAVCLLLMAVFLTVGPGEELPQQQQLPNFEALVERLIAEGDKSRQLRHRLQFAEAALVRDHPPLARSRFLRLRDRLMQQSDGEGSSREARELVQAYVEHRLSQLP